MFEGKAWTFGDDVNTDEIIPARFLVTSDPVELGQHCMAGLDPTFVEVMERGDLIVAGENFGCGSSREHAPISIKAAGIACVIAKSFARIFYRNAINIGLPILVSESASQGIRKGDWIKVDLAEGRIENETLKTSYRTESFPPFMQELMEAGGLMPWVARRMEIR